MMSLFQMNLKHFIMKHNGYKQMQMIVNEFQTWEDKKCACLVKRRKCTSHVLLHMQGN
jgi:hypothetical protein